MTATRHTISESPWTDVRDALPPFNTEVVAWMVGNKTHSDATWKREGKAFMVRWDPERERIHADKNGWAFVFMRYAREKLDADSLEITHWMLANKPEGLE